ncbi:protein of unassigned function [Methylobacterium oryzae CBMB20]|uniref:Protein of unassigned function n=1 Tax=Methylobacterium oryzae CBMB20 TaxID=693986 RepID=A0A089P0X6_9HYPH|nr:protein of unassigned function [Methylobacterium oryzae CBMB20]
MAASPERARPTSSLARCLARLLRAAKKKPGRSRGPGSFTTDVTSLRRREPG